MVVQLQGDGLLATPPIRHNHLAHLKIFSATRRVSGYGHLSRRRCLHYLYDWLAPTENSYGVSDPEFVQALLDLAKQMTGGNLTPQVLAQHQYDCKLHSIAINPDYFSPANACVAFTFGAHIFAYELLTNHSADHRRGFLTPEVFQSFFSYTRYANNELVFTYKN